MKKLFLLMPIGVLFFYVGVSAQQVNTDSLKLVSKISEYQLQLGKLQNAVDQTTRDKQDGALKAQESANRNSTQATRLSNDPQNKKVARDADNAAGDARSDSKKARKANDNLEKLNKKISDLQGKIYDEKVKLSKYTQLMPPPALVVAPPVQDSTQHL